MSKELKRGEIVRRSLIGERGFCYPDISGRSIMVRRDCTAIRQTGWNSCDGLSPYSVPSDAFSGKDQYGDQKPFMVVWTFDGS